MGNEGCDDMAVSDPPLLCVRQHIGELSALSLSERLHTMSEDLSEKELGRLIVSRLLEGIDQPPVKKVTITAGKGCDAAAVVRFACGKISILEWTRIADSGVEIALILVPSNPTIVGINIIHSVVNTNFYNLFHIAVTWITRRQFEGAFRLDQ